MEPTQDLGYVLNTLCFILAGALAMWMAAELRVSESDELEGLDLAECGMLAYPEFVSGGLGGGGTSAGSAVLEPRRDSVPDMAPAGAD